MTHTDPVEPFNLSADIFQEAEATTWCARLAVHPNGGGQGTLVWEKCGIRTEHNAVTAMEAQYQRLQTAGRKVLNL